MQKLDKLLNEFLVQPNRVADLLNVFWFGGKQIIRECDILEMDTQSLSILGNKPKIVSIKKYRDILKAISLEMNFVILGIEEQSEIHYAMPVRNMNYDAAAYDQQWRKIKREVRSRKNIKKSEFLSGMTLADRLKPVITIVVYCGRDKWDGPRDLHAMLDMQGVPKEVQSMIANYKLNLIELFHFRDYDKFKSDLKIVFGFVQMSEDKVKLRNYIENHSEELVNIPEDTYHAIRVLANTVELDKVNETMKNNEGSYNMCKGIQGMIEDGRLEGKIESILEILEELGEVPEKLRMKIMAQKESEVLTRYLKIAVKVKNIVEFEEEINRIN